MNTLDTLRAALRAAEDARCLANNIAAKAHTFGSADERADANRNLRVARENARNAALAYAAFRRDGTVSK